MPARTKILSLSLLLALPLAAHALERLELLPSDAQAYLRVSNTTNFWSGLKQSPIGKLWIDPQFQDFIGNPDAETWTDLFLDGNSEAENAILREEFKMLKGEVIFAFYEGFDEVAIIAAMEKEDYLKSLELDEKLNTLKDEPTEFIRSTFQGTEIIQQIPGDGDTTWQTYVDGTFIGGASKEWIEQCIVRLQKEKIEEPEGNPVFNLNLPLERLVDEWVEEMDGHGAATSTRSLVDALGLAGLENLSVALELKTDEMTVDSNLKISDLTKGIFSLLDLQPSEIPEVPFVPESISSFEVGRLDLPGLWKEIPDILASISPTAKPQLDMVIGMFMQQTGIDLEQDLLGNLGTQYLSYSQTEEGRQQVTVIALELKDSLAFKTALESMLSSPTLQMQLANSLEAEEFLDHTVYTVKTADPSENVAFGIAGDYLFYSQPEGLRQVIRSLAGEGGDNGSFNRSPLVKGLRKHMSARAFGFGAVDWRKNMATLIRELDKPEFTDAFAQGWATSGSPLPPPDFKKLPPADHIASFFNVSYQYVEATGDGLHQQIFLKY